MTCKQINSSPYVAITGPVGAGKTTLARKIARYLDALLVSEAFEINPFLAESTRNPETYAFETASHFLLLHMHQLKKAGLNGGAAVPMVSDFHIAHDRFFALQELEEKDLEAYDQLLVHVMENSPRPLVILALDVSWSTCWSRIGARARPHELSLGQEFFEPIHGQFAHWLETTEANNVLRIDFEDARLLESETALRQLTMDMRRFVPGAGEAFRHSSGSLIR